MIGCVRHVPLLGGWLDDPTLPERRPLSTLCERPLRSAHRIFVAKAMLGIPTTTALIERLAVDKPLRHILGWERRSQVPSEATFSRAFAEFAQGDLPGKMHAALIERSLGGRIIGAIARDATEIEAREEAGPEQGQRRQRRSPGAR